MLVLDSYSSHLMLEFDQKCKEHSIITLCLLLHSLYILQLLDVSCFSLLKHYYSEEIDYLAHYSVDHITKSEFLEAYTQARLRAITAANIQASFCSASV